MKISRVKYAVYPVNFTGIVAVSTTVHMKPTKRRPANNNANTGIGIANTDAYTCTGSVCALYQYRYQVSSINNITPAIGNSIRTIPILDLIPIPS